MQKPNQMHSRNSSAYTSRQRSKSLPSKISKQHSMFGSRSNPSYKQQMRMVSFNSKKTQQEPKTQMDIPSIQKSLDEFEHVLKNLQMTNSDISSLNVYMKELKDCLSHFPRFSSINPKQKDSFFKSWNNLKNQAIEKLHSGRPHSYENACQQLQEAKQNLEKIQTKSQSKQANSIMVELLKNFDDVHSNINELILNKSNDSYDQKMLHEQISKIKLDLLKLQSSAPTTKSNQDIARVLLEFDKVEKKEKSQQILDFNIEKTEKQLQSLIQVKPRTEFNSTKKDGQALSTVSSKKRRSKSVGAYDNKSRVSKTSRLSSMSLVSKQLNGTGQKIEKAKSRSLNLNHEINSLNIKINRIQKSISNYQAQLDEIIEANSIERDSYKRRLVDKIKKSGIPGCDTYEQKEKYLAMERKSNISFKQKLKEIETEEHERSELSHKIHETELWQTQVDEELKRAKNLHSCLQKLTSEDDINIQNTNASGAMEIKVDNDKLQEETEGIKTKITDTQKSINVWHESWRKSVGVNLIDNLENAPQNDIILMFKRSESDHQYITNWAKELDSQINQLETVANSLRQNSEKPDDDGLARLKEAVSKLHKYQNRSNSEFKSLPVSQQIQINKIEIDRLSKSENETKSESQEIEDLRNQNRQMIEWVKEIIDQIQSAMTTQSALKAQLDESIKTSKNSEEDDDKNKRFYQDIDELSNAIYERDEIKSEYEDNNTNMQQLYESMFDIQTNENFMQLCPQVKNRIQKLIEYDQLKEKFDRLSNPVAEVNNYSDHGSSAESEKYAPNDGNSDDYDENYYCDSNPNDIDNYENDANVF